MEGETTDQFGNTPPILSALTQLLSTVILPQIPVEIEHQWSGIMGVGKTKQPIVKKISPLVTVGIRMGGMGVALGSLIGKELADLQD
jgi:glycine/D-amino acid oxidase-like deaminating enzyme